MRDGIKWHRVRQIGQPSVDTVLLVHRHLVIFQRVVHVFAFQLLFEDAMTQQIGVAHAIGWDRL